MSLAFTKPAANSKLQEDITFGSVEKMLIDMCMDVSATGGVVNVDTGEIAAASAGDGAELDGVNSRSISSGTTRALHRYAWKIPEAVEKGFEIPIAITSVDSMPEPGEFQRLAMDVAVNAVWLGVYVARLELNEEAVSALKALILDWPMDFIFFEGESPEIIEQKKFKWAVNMSTGVERLRQHVGLEGMNIMRIVATASGFVKRGLASGEKAKPVAARAFLVDGVNWGAAACPDVETVRRHMVNWAAIEQKPGCKDTHRGRCFSMGA